jgi:hypothetical protein
VDGRKAADDALKVADSARTAATSQERNVKIALFKNQLQRAKKLLADARDSYEPSHDYDLALKNLENAEKLVFVDFSLPQPDSSERDDFLRSIRKERDTCNAKKILR